MIDWSGIYHILATPFTDEGALDLDGVPRLIERALATGVRGLTILGIAGEAHRLTDDERRAMVQAVVKEVRGRVPVAVGVSAPGTHLACAFAETARAHGADAVMVAPPSGAKSLDAVADYYQAVARAARLPVVLQDEPVTTQVAMPAPFLARLCAELRIRHRRTRRSGRGTRSSLRGASSCLPLPVRWRRGTERTCTHTRGSRRAAGRP